MSGARGRISSATISRTCRPSSATTICACRRRARAQADSRARHGIHGFCYYYYWFNGRRLLERPLDEVVASGEPDFPFCVCWANENWSRRWDGGNDELLIAQTYSPENERRLIEDLLPVLAIARYIRVGGTAAAARLPRESAARRRARAADTFRRVARDSGDRRDLYLAFVAVPGLPAPDALGIRRRRSSSRRTGFEVGAAHRRRSNRSTRTFSGEVWDYISAAKIAMARPLPAYRLFRGVMVGWDNTPRLQNNGQIFVNSHPANYGRWLSAIVEQTRRAREPDERIVFVNAWNEWGEGCHLEPDQAFRPRVSRSHARRSARRREARSRRRRTRNGSIFEDDDETSLLRAQARPADDPGGADDARVDGSDPRQSRVSLPAAQHREQPRLGNPLALRVQRRRGTAASTPATITLTALDGYPQLAEWSR